MDYPKVEDFFHYFMALIPEIGRILVSLDWPSSCSMWPVDKILFSLRDSFYILLNGFSLGRDFKFLMLKLLVRGEFV